MVAVVVAAFVGACAIYVYATRRQQGIIKGALHEETPLFFDSAKRTTYHTELVAGEKLFPSNDPVLVTWRVDYDSVKLVKKLARGAFGEVWIGRYRGAKVAVKKLIEEQFIGVAWTRLTDMLAVVEFMDSGDLRSLLDTNRHLKWSPTKLKYAQDAIDAIVYLHSLSVPIIHRDLKSRNILIDSKKGAKLADFGVSATKRNDDMTTGVGTARWLAPELARGETKYTEAVDIYSFGVILAEMDTHELPFSDAMNFNGTEKLSDVAILQRVSAGKLSVSFSPRCPPKIRELAERCTSFNPKDRPAAAEVSYELRKHDVLDYPS
ncbi:TPA: hypothetical protein N0F65_006107 [Lagenidium giganteum]|uniref:Protein kinase domain-containing protein n=1 Tax=Lagenidium giganteum TaxID=4803 RepID=A0AAV2Z2I9_9STRA|nr:TPA: hypothetical protein N0F65_006107 [Lagenidium giganteum]